MSRAHRYRRRQKVLGDIAVLPIVVDQETSGKAWHDTMSLAERHCLTVHDAAYLERAMRLRLPLASFDPELRRAAPAEGVALL